MKIRPHWSWVSVPVLCLLAMYSGLAQHTSTDPAYHATAVRSYDISDGMPDRCVEMAVIAPDGRLIIIPCPFVQIAQKTYAYVYDGSHAYLKYPDVVPGAGQWFFQPCGIYQEQMIYGYLQDQSASHGINSYFFTFDMTTDDWTVVPCPEFDGTPVVATHVSMSDDGVFLLAEVSDAVLVYRHGKEKWERVISVSTQTGPYGQTLRGPMAFQPDNGHYMFTCTDSMLYRVDMASGQVKKTDQLKHLQRAGVPGNRFCKLPTGEILYVSNIQREIFILNEEMHRETWEPQFARGLPAGVGKFLFTDQQDNHLFMVVDTSGQVRAWLIQASGAVYTYTAAATALQEVLTQDMRHLTLNSADFNRGFFVVGREFIAMDVTTWTGVVPVKSGPSRGVIELPDGRWVLGRRRYVKDGTVYPNADLPPCFQQMHPDGDVLRSGKFTWHGTRGAGIRQYNMEDGTCGSFLPGATVSRLTLSSDSRLYAIADKTLVRLDERHTSVDTIIDEPIQPFVSDLLVARDGVIYLGTSDGLLAVDTVSDTLRPVLLSRGDRPIQVQSLYEDRSGRLWVGTHGAGIKIYTPGEDNIASLDRSNGLSNDIVAFAVEDDDGDVWVGTYHGVTIFDQNANILGYLYEESGLVDNECNRWSGQKLSDNRLVFGSPSGFSIVDPTTVKDNWHKQAPPLIYPVQIAVGGELYDCTDARFEHIITNGVRVPAADRSVRISYALSSYASPDANSYAYKLDLPGHDWNYVGGLTQLNLSGLPAGNYDLLLRGSSHLGIESGNVAVISLQVREFFYRTWWFYSLCAIPFAVIAFLWIRRQHHERRRLEMEVTRRTRTIRDQADALRELDKVKTNLYTNITHEFRTPLTVIRGLADQTDSDEKASELIKRNADHLLELVNQMLDLRKLESGNLQLDLVQSDLIQFLRYLGESFRSIAQLRFQQFHFLSERNSLLMDFDPDKLTRVISNLLSNAIKFTPEGGDIYLQVEWEDGDDEVVIKVMDTGIGIPADQLERIFERFYQVDDSTTRRGEGTGIGLTLARSMIDLMRGELRVSSRPGQGSTFTVTLPWSRDARLEEAIGDRTNILPSAILQMPSEPVTANTESLSNLPEVLIVEDNPDVVHYLSACLNDQYKLRIAMDGREGIEKALEYVPDLVVSDVMMPEKDGFELCEELKSTELTSHIPVILLTAKADAESRLRGLSRGADAYLEKPFNKEELLVRIEKLLELRANLQQRYAGTERPGYSESADAQIEDAFIVRFRETFESHLGDPDFGIAEMCEALHVGRTQLHNKISALTGMSTSLFMRHLRLKAATALLRDPGNNISEVAYAVGFKDPKYFAKVFKQEFGMTPSAYAEAEQ